VTRNYVLNRIKNVIESCKTVDQLKVAQEYCKILKRKFLSQLQENSVIDSFDKLLQAKELDDFTEKTKLLHTNITTVSVQKEG
jgi:uncharacterized protein YnzC (UPF0291/DUF896 family)